MKIQKTMLDKKLDKYAENRIKGLRDGLEKFSRDLVIRYPEMKRHGGCR